MSGKHMSSLVSSGMAEYMSGCNIASGFMTVDVLSVQTAVHRDTEEIDLQNYSSQRRDPKEKQELEIQHQKFVAVVTEEQQVAVFGNYDEYDRLSFSLIHVSLTDLLQRKCLGDLQ